MKHLFIIIVSLLFFNCKQNRVIDEVCINSFQYRHQKYSLAVDIIDLRFNDKNQLILKKLKTDWITKIVFFDSKLKDAEFSDGHLITSKDSVIIRISTSYFQPELGKKEMTSKEVENLLLKDSIGLVYKKDTLIVKHCK